MTVGAATQNALLGLLSPLWQSVIAVCVIAALVVGVVRLARRGPSRMTAVLAFSGAAVLGICALGWLLGQLA